MSWFKRRTKAVPEPWDGIHQLRYIGRAEFFGDGPSDYCAGWRWQCTCGSGTREFAGRYYASSEQRALDEYRHHQDNYSGINDARSLR